MFATGSGSTSLDGWIVIISLASVERPVGWCDTGGVSFRVRGVAFPETYRMNSRIISDDSPDSNLPRFTTMQSFRRNHSIIFVAVNIFGAVGVVII